MRGAVPARAGEISGKRGECVFGGGGVRDLSKTLRTRPAAGRHSHSLDALGAGELLDFLIAGF